MSELTGAEARPAAEGDPTSVVNKLAQWVLALIPALIAALAAIGGATGGLARLFRDENRLAVLAVGLTLLALVLAAVSRGVSPATAAGRPRARATAKAVCLVLSLIVLFTGLAIAFGAQIAVMGTSQAPEISGSVSRNGQEYLLEGNVRASGVKSTNRITIFAYQSVDETWTTEDVNLMQSSSGPNSDGVVNVPIKVPIHSDNIGRVVVLTAVLGEDRRDCDGRLARARAAKLDTRTVACLVLRMP